jgi:hypothetical protein
LITGGRGGVWSRLKYDHEILEQPLMDKRENEDKEKNGKK